MLSAVILTWNSERYIARCVESLLADAQRSALPIEVFVVDGGSSDGTLALLERMQAEKDGINLIRLPRNRGTTLSRNLALRRCAGQYVLVLDSDTEVLPGALAALIATTETSQSVGIACPRLLYADGSVQPSCMRFPTLGAKLLKPLPFSSAQRLARTQELYHPLVYDKHFTQTVEVDYCIAAAWLINRRALQEVGLLDENIFYAPEGIDYCLRMWLSGWKVLYNPLATVLHHTQRASYRRLGLAWAHLRGLLHYFRKHGYWFDRNKLYARLPSRQTPPLPP